MPRGNKNNLKLSQSPEEARENGKKGGKRSGEVRREKSKARDVAKMILSGNIGAKGSVGAQLNNDIVNEQLKNASGVRFKVMGDGKNILFMVHTSGDSDNFHQASVSTKSGSVVNVDIPFSKLTQPGSGVKVPFNKKNINGISFQVNAGNNTPRAATIKIFDFEIY